MEAKFTDDGVAYLKNLTRLEQLVLVDKHITNLSLKELQGMKSLKWLYLRETSVTDASVKELQRERSDMAIFRYPLQPSE